MAVTINGSTGIQLDDNDKQKFGTGDDLEIYHDGSNSYLINTTGFLRIKDESNVRIDTDAFAVNKGDNSEAMIVATANGAVELYHNNSKKLQTESYGNQAFGEFFIGDGDGSDASNHIRLGNGGDLKIFHDGSNSKIHNNTGRLDIETDSFRLYNHASSENMIDGEANGAVKLYHNNSVQLETTSTGCDIFNVYGNVVGGSIRDLYIRNDGRLGYDSSVRASKVNIADLTDVSWLDDLKPKTFNKKKQDNTGAFTSENYTQLEYGLIAEDVETVNKELCSYSTEDVLEAVHYKKLITPILKALQDARTEITTLKAKVAALEAA